MNPADLIAFEERVAAAFEAREVRGPIHLSGGNEEQLIEIFSGIDREDYVFSTYRSHYHALLHGLDPEWLMEEIKAGRSMNIRAPRFYTSAIVGGCLPIAVGVAAALKRQGSARKVWCFVGDMAASIGAYHEALQYADGHDLPIRFVVEDNQLSCDSPTLECWGGHLHFPNGCIGEKEIRYQYERKHAHVGIGKFVAF